MRFTYPETKTLVEKKIAVPMNSRQPNEYDSDIFLGSPFKPNPIKHWRKQLFSNYQSKSKPTIDDVENPNNCVISEDDTNVLYTHIISTTTCDGLYADGQCRGGTNNIRRTSTILKPNYFSSTKQYLQKRCKTFEQNQSIGQRKSGNVYYSTDNTCKTIVHKPSNSTFKTQGAVSAEGYTAKVKYDTLSSELYTPGKKKEPECCKL